MFPLQQWYRNIRGLRFILQGGFTSHLSHLDLTVTTTRTHQKLVDVWVTSLVYNSDRRKLWEEFPGNSEENTGHVQQRMFVMINGKLPRVLWAAKILRMSPAAPGVSVLFHLTSSDRWSDQKALPQHCQVSEEKEKANCLKSRGRRVYSHIPAPQAWCLHDFLCVIWLSALSRTELLTHLCSCQSCESAFIIVVLPLVPQGGLLQHKGSRSCCDLVRRHNGREEMHRAARPQLVHVSLLNCCSAFQETVTKLYLGCNL